MSDIEAHIDSDASNEGEIDLVERNYSNDDSSDEEIEKRNEEGAFVKRMEEMKKKWKRTPVRKKMTKKDIMDKKLINKLLFEPKTILDCFNKFMSTELKQMIVNYTNLKGKRENSDNPEGFKEIDMNEFDAFLGILIAAGVTNQSKVYLQDLWKDNCEFVPPVFAAIMSRNRVQEIMKYLRFDDKQERQNKLKDDKIAAIRGMYEFIVSAFKSSYIPGEDLTVDERISPFKGRIGFRVYMPNKPNPYGIKMWMLCDAVNYSVSNFIIYSGKVGNQREVYQGEKVVMKLTAHLKSSHNITTDNFFTSIPLAIRLLEREIDGKKTPLTLLGTLRSNRKFIPQSIKNHVVEEKEKRKKEKKGTRKKEGGDFDYPSRFAYTDQLQLVSYMYKKDKSVIILSSGHPNPKVSKEGKKKPELVLDYNKTKYGVDKVDEITKRNTCLRGTRRWTVNLFYNFIDMICHNSFVAYSMAVNDKITRRDFLTKLVLDLCAPYTSGRTSSHPTMRRTTKDKIDRFLSTPESSSGAAASQESYSELFRPRKDERCDLCPGAVRNRNRGTRFCVVSHKKACPNHQKPVKCINCD